MAQSTALMAIIATPFAAVDLAAVHDVPEPLVGQRVGPFDERPKLLVDHVRLIGLDRAADADGAVGCLEFHEQGCERGQAPHVVLRVGEQPLLGVDVQRHADTIGPEVPCPAAGSAHLPEANASDPGSSTSAHAPSIPTVKPRRHPDSASGAEPRAAAPPAPLRGLNWRAAYGIRPACRRGLGPRDRDGRPRCRSSDRSRGETPPIGPWSLVPRPTALPLRQRPDPDGARALTPAAAPLRAARRAPRSGFGRRLTRDQHPSGAPMPPFPAARARMARMSSLRNGESVRIGPARRHA